jgi:hypothetical protein
MPENKVKNSIENIDPKALACSRPTYKNVSGSNWNKKSERQTFLHSSQ